MKNQKKSYERPCIQVLLVELEQGIAAGSANINTGADSQVPQEREFENGWSKSSDFDL